MAWTEAPPHRSHYKTSSPPPYNGATRRSTVFNCVKSVTHKIKCGECNHNFTLTSNALLSIVPTVNP